LRSTQHVRRRGVGDYKALIILKALPSLGGCRTAHWAFGEHPGLSWATAEALPTMQGPRVVDALLSSLLDPLEGLGMVNYEKLELGGAPDFQH
jgi:hypothetical protein